MASINTDFRHYPDWIHQELINWARWCWLGAYPHPLPPDHCQSVEWRYIAPSDLSNEPIEPRPIINERHALIVQSVYDSLESVPRVVLCVEYPRRNESGRGEHGKGYAAKSLHMSTTEYDAALMRAIGRVWDVLEGRY